MHTHQTIVKGIAIPLSTILVLAIAAFWAQPSLAVGPEGPTSTPVTQVITYVVQAGDTLTRIGNRYSVTVGDLVAWNDIENPDLIEIGQVLTLQPPAGWTPAPNAQAAGTPLSFTWSMIGWSPADPNYVATIAVQAQGGQPPYTYYHDGLAQQGSSFELVWRRCRPKPGSVGVADATGTYVKEDYWFLAPYCPVGVEIVEPEEGAQLKHYPRNFNVTWQATVDPAPALYGMEIEVWENGSYQAWKTYERFDDNLFFVPDPFPGDLAGRVRMWSIYEGIYEGPKTPWRPFEFRVTY